MILKLKNNYLFIFLLLILTITGLYLRFYHIEFGLPQSFYADEPEIAEIAINYTYQLKDIIRNNNYYKLIPISYVYGTLPSYIFTFFTMVYSKTSNFLGIPPSKENLYIGMRVFNALISFLLAPLISFLYFKLFKNKKGSLVLFALMAFNWKLIVHAHYLNADILLSILLVISWIFLYYFLISKTDNKFTILCGIFFGLAVGTKITALISLPIYLFLFMRKGAYKNAFAFTAVAFGSYCLSNPFSLIFFGDFIYRIYEMLFKEGGMVFDSVDYGYFKYIFALSWMATLPLFSVSLYGIYRILKNKNIDTFQVFLILNIAVYIMFFSIQSRRVDRWVLPILPLILMYGTQGILELNYRSKKYYTVTIIMISCFLYLFFPLKLTQQFQRDTPKSAAYKWVQSNLPPLSPKLVYTEEGLDPMTKVPGAKVIKYNVYTSENAQLELPRDPTVYQYIIISSRVMQNYKKTEVIKNYPYYANKWENFENLLNDTEKFQLIKAFTLPKPNLVPLSDIYIYRNLYYSPTGNPLVFYF